MNRIKVISNQDTTKFEDEVSTYLVTGWEILAGSFQTSGHGWLTIVLIYG